MPNVISREDFENLTGQDLEPSDWMDITQERVNQFADATNDHQFIHIDEARASATPFGGTIAHGFLSLSLITHLTSMTMPIPEGTVMTINSGPCRATHSRDADGARCHREVAGALAPENGGRHRDRRRGSAGRRRRNTVYAYHGLSPGGD